MIGSPSEAVTIAAIEDLEEDLVKDLVEYLVQDPADDLLAEYLLAEYPTADPVKYVLAIGDLSIEDLVDWQSSEDAAMEAPIEEGGDCM